MREALSEDLAVAKAADQPLSEEESIILEATKMVRNLYAVSRQFYCALPEEAHLLVKSGLLSVCLKYRMDIDSRLAGH